MGSLNRVTLIGRLGGDARLSKTTSGHLVANFNIATNEVWKNKEGEKEKRVEWHRIVLWGTPAEKLNEYLKKGRLVCIEGRLQSSSWENGETSYKSVNVVADSVRFLDSSKKEEKAA